MLLYLVALLPSFIFIATAYWSLKKRERDDAKYAPAYKDRLLRPAGEGLRIEIEKMDDELNDMLAAVLAIMLGSIVLGIAFISLSEERSMPWIVGFISFCASVMMVRAWKELLPLAEKRRRYRRGFDGERLVGEHLSLLMLDGYRVFNDVPFDGFNVDHVVVGQAGVFGIETKTHRKRKDLAGNYKVKFDGQKLHWPDGSVNDFGVKNAYDRALSLQQWLTSAVGTSIPVAGFLVFPGWMVQEERLGKVRVLNPKNVRGYISAIEKKGAVLSEQRIQQIVHQLTEKVRLPDA